MQLCQVGSSVATPVAGRGVAGMAPTSVPDVSGGAPLRTEAQSGLVPERSVHEGGAGLKPVSMAGAAESAAVDMSPLACALSPDVSWAVASAWAVVSGEMPLERGSWAMDWLSPARSPAAEGRMALLATTRSFSVTPCPDAAMADEAASDVWVFPLGSTSCLVVAFPDREAASPPASDPSFRPQAVRHRVINSAAVGRPREQSGIVCDRTRCVRENLSAGLL